MSEPGVFEVVRKEGESEGKALADTALRPTVQSALTLSQFATSFGEIELSDLVNSLSDQVRLALDGNLDRAEAVLVTQAHTLDVLFNSLAQRSALNMGEYFEAAEKYMKLALRAQSQCRATLDTLANMQKPAVDLVTHTNIAHGPQQINFHQSDDKGQPGENQKPPNELLEHTEHEPDEWLDKGAPRAAGEDDTDLETVGEIDGANVA